MKTVAALFVETNGVYSTLPKVDCWGVERDALRYRGDEPIVAHPPCHLWTNLANVNFARWGGAHNRPGNDGGCFRVALASVRHNGGVLEHPAGSHAWPFFGLRRPNNDGGWSKDGSGLWVCEVWQSAYGHRARKRTWLLYSGNRTPLEADWTRTPGTHQIGWFDRKKPTLGKKEASRTPLSFATYLVRLARHSV